MIAKPINSLSSHLADLLTFPKIVLDNMQTGSSFAVSIRGEKGHAVALHEAHEMLINKDMKSAIIRPSKTYLQKTSLFLQFRKRAYKHSI